MKVFKFVEKWTNENLVKVKQSVFLWYVSLTLNALLKFQDKWPADISYYELFLFFLPQKHQYHLAPIRNSANFQSCCLHPRTETTMWKKKLRDSTNIQYCASWRTLCLICSRHSQRTERTMLITAKEPSFPLQVNGTQWTWEPNIKENLIWFIDII